MQPRRVLAADVGERTGARVRSHVIVPADAAISDVSGVTFRDAAGRVASAYGFDVDRGADAPQVGSIPAYLIRPDGFVSYRTSAIDLDRLAAHLARTLQ